MAMDLLRIYLSFLTGMMTLMMMKNSGSGWRRRRTVSQLPVSSVTGEILLHRCIKPQEIFKLDCSFSITYAYVYVPGFNVAINIQLLFILEIYGRAKAFSC